MIAIGCDHGGFELKEAIVAHLKEQGIEVLDEGIYKLESVNYPEIAKKVCADIKSGSARLGILCCGTGIGMSMAANKVNGIRAAVASDTFSARFTRLHNDANVLCLGGRVLGQGLALDMVDLFIKTEFEGGRHSLRVDMITDIEKEQK